MLPVLILAGGLGTRLGIRTKEKPKYLVEINGMPFLEWQLRLLEEQQVEHVVFALGHFSEQIKEYLQCRKSMKLTYDISLDGKILRGTGGAIQNAIPYLGSEFIVIYGDSYLPISFQNVVSTFKPTQYEALMTYTSKIKSGDAPNVVKGARESILYDKSNDLKNMQNLDYGLNIFKSKVFENEEKEGFLDLAIIQKNLSLAGKLQGKKVDSPYFEVGSESGILDFSRYLKEMELNELH